jgi:hypothetical protein
MSTPKFQKGDRIVSIPENQSATVRGEPKRTEFGYKYSIHIDSTPAYKEKEIYDKCWVLADSDLIFTKGEQAIYVNPRTKAETRGTVEEPAFDLRGKITSDVIVRGSVPDIEPLYFITIDCPVDYIYVEGTAVGRTMARKIVNSNHLKKIMRIEPFKIGFDNNESDK